MTDDITRRREHRLADNDLVDANRARGLPADTGVAITDVDCTPRPRRGEAQAAFEARIAGYMREAGLVQREVNQRNRQAALRSVLVARADGTDVAQFWTQCACGWCGLRVADPEVARREYDAHACAAENVGNDAVSRAQAHAGKATMPAKRTAAVLQPALVEQRDPLAVVNGHGEVVGRRNAETNVDDDFTQRVKLLETDR